ncbi:MAG: MBL fold metallo-hydrolase [Oscillospiraceae bacterium]|nr:MBL fold metallo-hydrolase [Oscillospiraceae bacterium]
MKITFLGATHEVTGSCTFLEVGGHCGIVDFGMEQGKDFFVNQELPVEPAGLDFVLLTHAHIDHSGRLPLLCKRGFRGGIYLTEATANLCDIMLRDSANIQLQEAEWQARKSQRAGEENPAAEPLYDLDDVQAAVNCFRPCKLGELIHIGENVAVRFVSAGHLLGSASIEVWLTEDGVTKKIAFSGDLGNRNMPIIRGMDHITEADYIVVESTYGTRLHETTYNSAQYLAGVIQRTLDRGGNVVIPSFAVGRTQEMLYLLREIKNAHLVKGHGDFPVYVDSPLAVEATSIFLQCSRDCFDEPTQQLLASGVNPLMFPGLKISVSSDESKQINDEKTPKVILSSSGMCEGGRIRHHLKHNLWRKECTILFVGYQAAGTLGRILLDGGKKTVKLFGEDIAVAAEILFMPGKSGHADQDGLLDWLRAFEKAPEMVFVNHGEDEVTEAFAGLIGEKLGWKSYAPYSGTVYDLAAGDFALQTVGVPVAKKSAETPQAQRKRALFEKLVAAGKRLNEVIRACEGMSNKDVGKFTDQINRLCEKWQK